MTPAAEQAGLEVAAVKRDGLDRADEQGNAFLSLFSTFGTFAIAAGILLIFLIFVMLAAERRTEMGIARAVGTQRRHLVQTFVFEGALYDLVAAAVGALVGLGVAYGMVEIVSSAFTTEKLAIEHAVRPTSLVVAYGLGVVLTLLVVTLSARRVSVLDVVTAIRNLPSPLTRANRRAHWGAALWRQPLAPSSPSPGRPAVRRHHSSWASRSSSWASSRSPVPSAWEIASPTHSPALRSSPGGCCPATSTTRSSATWPGTSPCTSWPVS